MGAELLRNLFVHLAAVVELFDGLLPCGSYLLEYHASAFSGIPNPPFPICLYLGSVHCKYRDIFNIQFLFCTTMISNWLLLPHSTASHLRSCLSKKEQQAHKYSQSGGKALLPQPCVQSRRMAASFSVYCGGLGEWVLQLQHQFWWEYQQNLETTWCKKGGQKGYCSLIRLLLTCRNRDKIVSSLYWIF